MNQVSVYSFLLYLNRIIVGPRSHRWTWHKYLLGNIRPTCWRADEKNAENVPLRKARNHCLQSDCLTTAQHLYRQPSRYNIFLLLVITVHKNICPQLSDAVSPCWKYLINRYCGEEFNYVLMIVARWRWFWPRDLEQSGSPPPLSCGSSVVRYGIKTSEDSL